MRYFLEIAYDGTDFHGWQRQPELSTIQSEIEDNISKILRKKTILVGCGRTDAGVHARQFFAHTNVDNPIDENIIFRLNNMLPKSISILKHFEVPPQLHAQRDALSRTYDYYIRLGKAPFAHEFSSRYYHEDLDEGSMKAASSLLLNYKDYFSFCKKPELYKHTICEVYDASVSFNKTFPHICFQIIANRFLQSMVRLLIARILEVGFGRITLQEFESYLRDKRPLQYKTPAYPQGLILSKVEYDFGDIQKKIRSYTWQV